MKVRIKVQPSGLINGEFWPEVGEEIDLPDVAAVDLLNAGHATPVEDKPKAEKAVAPKGTTRAKKG